MNVTKRFWVLLTSALIVLAMILSGCGGSSVTHSRKEASNADSGEGGTSQSPGDLPQKVAYIPGTGGLGDKSFNDLGYQGIKRLMNKGVVCDVAEPKSIAEVEGLLRNFANTGEYTLIITMGGDAVDSIKKVATDYPEQNFMVIDGMAGMDNVKSVAIIQTDTGFLVGAYAGLMEKEGNLAKGQGKNIVGVVGGNDIPLIRGILTAYECGVRYVNADCKVLTAYVGSWNDPGKGSELTQGMYEQGASIVFQAAGASGMGVIEAAQKSDLYALGYDGNQNTIAPDHMIGSGARGLDSLIEQTAEEALSGAFKGGDYNIGMKDNPLSSQIILDGTNVDIPDHVKQNLEKIKEFLVNSEQEIPSEPDQIAEYLEKVGTFTK